MNSFLILSSFLTCLLYNKDLGARYLLVKVDDMNENIDSKDVMQMNINAMKSSIFDRKISKLFYFPR